MLFTQHNKSKIVANKFIIVDYLQPALHKGSRLPTLTKAKNCLPDAELTLGIQQFININTRAATINYQNKKKSNVGEGQLYLLSCCLYGILGKECCALSDLPYQ